MLLAPVTAQVLLEVLSTSDALSVPATVDEPASVTLASVTAPTLAAVVLVATGVSFVPLTVTTTVWST